MKYNFKIMLVGAFLTINTFNALRGMEQRKEERARELAEWQKQKDEEKQRQKQEEWKIFKEALAQKAEEEELARKVKEEIMLQKRAENIERLGGENKHNELLARFAQIRRDLQKLRQSEAGELYRNELLKLSTEVLTIMDILHPSTSEQEESLSEIEEDSAASREKSLEKLENAINNLENNFKRLTLVAQEGIESTD